MQAVDHFLTTMDFIGLNEAINRWCTVIKNYTERVAKDEQRRKEQEEFRKMKTKDACVQVDERDIELEQLRNITRDWITMEKILVKKKQSNGNAKMLEKWIDLDQDREKELERVHKEVGEEDSDEEEDDEEVIEDSLRKLRNQGYKYE